MPGIDKILDNINQQGRENADAVINSAEKKAQDIRLKGDAYAEKAYNEYISSFKTKMELEYSSACATAESAMKKEILKCKSDCIDKAVETALQKLHSLPDDEYFALILRLAGDKLRSGKGTIYFGKRDLARLSADFEKTLRLLAETAGSSLIISDTPADIDDGFILCYGNIYENCSFRDIAESEKNAVRDLAASILFA